MDVQQRVWTENDGWSQPLPDGGDAALVLLFGAAGPLSDPDLYEEVRKAWPEATIAGCTTAGEIAGTHVSDDSLVATAVRPRSSQIQAVSAPLQEDSREAGRDLVALLPREGLRHVMTLSEGVHVNGTSLVEGMQQRLPPGVAVTGGLAGDGPRFERTLVRLDDDVGPDRAVAIGFYGDALRVGFGSLGGWDPFGPQRRVTRAEHNVLYTLDGRPALQLYKTYLGEEAAGLPATGLLFPLSIDTGRERELVRTILAVDEDAQTMTFAGDIPEGAKARLMKANFDRLVDGAQGAAESTREALAGSKPDLAILISCVGRKLVLKQRTEEELEAVEGVLGAGTPMAGFYSYGEICPAAPGAGCELHNQTMTITTLREA